jgi:hypothetical protein
MNASLDRLARELSLDAANLERLRLAFGFACAQRVRHLLEEPRVEACLAGLGGFLAGTVARSRLDELAAEAGRLANRHPGSNSIDGCGHAAVSATYAVARALAGKAVEAADYAAYAIVYAQGGAAAVAERACFEPEFAWQTGCLAALAEAQTSSAVAHPPLAPQTPPAVAHPLAAPQAPPPVAPTGA